MGGKGNSGCDASFHRIVSFTRMTKLSTETEIGLSTSVNARVNAIVSVQRTDTTKDGDRRPKRKGPLERRLGEASDNCKGAKDVFKGLGDVAAEVDVARLYSEAVESLGGIDVAVLNARVGRHGNVEDVSVEDFDLQFNTNVRGVFLWLKHILPHMKGRKSGQIIVTSRVVGERAAAGKSIYSATKHAVQGMIEGLPGERLPPYFQERLQQK